MHSDESEINFRWWLFCGGTMPFFSLPFFFFPTFVQDGVPVLCRRRKMTRQETKGDGPSTAPGVGVGETFNLPPPLCDDGNQM